MIDERRIKDQDSMDVVLQLREKCATDGSRLYDVVLCGDGGRLLITFDGEDQAHAAVMVQALVALIPYSSTEVLR